MKRCPLLLILAALLPVACTDAPTLSKPKAAEYLEPTSPGNVVHNLIEAYTHKETDPYAQLLAPEFTFRFQPEDAGKFNTDALSQDEDVMATRGLFTTPSVGDIQILLTHAEPDSAGEAGFPAGTMRVRVSPTFLSISRYGGAWTVDGDIEDLFLCRGDPGAGENPEHWFLIEWRDIPGQHAKPGVPPLTAGPAAVIPATWGSIKAQFVPGLFVPSSQGAPAGPG